MGEFTQRLLNWHQSNKGSFPWKKTSDPYLIWVSEIILQQTRIQQGLPYYLAFAKKFPTVQALARASEDAVLQIWKGLGYYSRARNMHHTAKHIVENLEGVFPASYDGLIKLKGIGPYSAAAISSFAFGEKQPVIDGNVIRVLTRYFGVEDIISKASTKKKLLAYATELISEADPALFNQAIMDFGSKMCKPQNPKCDTCPLNNNCIGWAEEEVEKYPVKAKKQVRKNRFFHFLVCIDYDKYLISKRKEKDIWLGLYQFPMIETAQPGKIENSTINKFLKNELGTENQVLNKFSKEIKQVLSHQIIYGYFYKIDLNEMNWNNTAYMLVDKKNLSNFAVPKIVDRYLKG